MTITLTPRPDLAAVDVRVTGAGATVTLYRTDREGQVDVVRGSPFTTQGGTLALVDHEAPFGLVTYATDARGADAVSTTLDVDVPWLTSPAAPFLSYPVVVVDDTEHTYPPRSYLFDVIDRADPVYTWYRRSTRAGMLTLGYRSSVELAHLRSILSTGAPLLVRYPPGCAHMGGGFYAMGEARELPLVAGGDRGSMELDYVVVVGPPGVPAATPGWSWLNVAASYPTWAALVAAFPTWADVVTHAPQPRTLPAPAPVFGT